MLIKTNPNDFEVVYSIEQDFPRNSLNEAFVENLKVFTLRYQENRSQSMKNVLNFDSELYDWQGSIKMAHPGHSALS